LELRHQQLCPRGALAGVFGSAPADAPAGCASGPNQLQFCDAVLPLAASLSPGGGTTSAE
ncbi:unnamed protein product, partial [Effrenium voratum]